MLGIVRERLLILLTSYEDQVVYNDFINTRYYIDLRSAHARTAITDLRTEYP